VEGWRHNGTCRLFLPQAAQQKKNAPLDATETTLRWSLGPRGWARAKARPGVPSQASRKADRRLLPLRLVLLLLSLPPSRLLLLLLWRARNGPTPGPCRRGCGPGWRRSVCECLLFAEFLFCSCDECGSLALFTPACCRHHPGSPPCPPPPRASSSRAATRVPYPPRPPPASHHRGPTLQAPDPRGRRRRF
jgi:hypothetical protein